MVDTSPNSSEMASLGKFDGALYSSDSVLSVTIAWTKCCLSCGD